MKLVFLGTRGEIEASTRRHRRHTSLEVSYRLGRCEKEGVPRAVFTHCGSEIVKGDERSLGARLHGWAAERGLEAAFAVDGMELVLRS